MFLAAQPAADSLSGRVVGITDGDTLTVLVDRQQLKVRLVEIDAPEKEQPFGNRSKQPLAELCFNKTVVLVDKGLDRYGRYVSARGVCRR
jgi:micrococcal nuclease